MGSLLRSRRSDSGMALFVAMAAIALMFLLTTTAFYFASQTLFETKLADQHDAAFQAASSGVMVAFADLRSRLGSLPAGGGPYEGTIATSTASYVAMATYSAVRAAYDCTSTGTSRDGTKEVVVASFSIVRSGPVPLQWGFNVFYFAGGYQAGSVNGGGVVSGALFILMPPVTPFPTVDFGGNMSLSGGPIYIQNGNFRGNSSAPLTVYTNETATGTNIRRMSLDQTGTLTVTRVDLASYLATSLVNASRQSTDNLLGDTTTAVTEATAPLFEASSYTRTRYAGVAPSGPYKVVGTPDSTTGLTITSSTNSFGYVSGSTHDDFAYDPTNHTLYVEGTVYVYGNLTISQDITYEGNGMIVCTGVISMGANVVPSTSDGLPDARHLLCGFSSGALTFTKNNTKCVGAFYAKGAVSLGVNQLTLIGSFVSEGGVSAANNSLTITAVPSIGNYSSPGLPNLVTTSNGPAGSLGLKMTAWRRL